MHTKAEALKKKISGVKNKVVDKTSDVLSLPKRSFYKNKENRANEATKIIKATRSFNEHKVPNFDHKGNYTEAGKHRDARENIEKTYKKSNMI